MSDLPGDIQIDLAIRKLGFGSPCGNKLIDAKIKRFIEANQTPQPKKKRV